jgi:NTP pyrophosphatase (non-canonical NTP hydrolase)
MSVPCGCGIRHGPVCQEGKRLYEVVCAYCQVVESPEFAQRSIQERDEMWRQYEQARYVYLWHCGEVSVTGVQEYQQVVSRTLAVTEPVRVMDLALLGMLGELGEIAEPVKKYLYSGHVLDVSHVEEEIGDLLWYLANLCNVLGIEMQHAMQRNIEKLQQRYPDGFEAARSISRPAS